MDKKAGGLTTFILVMIIVGCAVLILGAIMNENLAEDARNALFSLGFGIVPDKEVPPEPPIIEPPPDVIGTFNDLFNKITEALGNDQTGCLVRYSGIRLSGVYAIKLTSGGIQLGVKSGNLIIGTGDDENHKKNLPNFEPCIVAGQGGVNFYGNKLDGSPGSVTPEYDNSVIIADIVIVSDEEFIRNYPLGTSFYLKEGSGNDHFLYKADATHICLMPNWHDPDWWECTESTTPERIAAGLDDDCFDKDETVMNPYICS